VAAKKKSSAKAKTKAAEPPRDISNRTIDMALVKALAHPLRVEILAILNDRMASPNELSKELEEGLSQVSYHVKVLKDFKCIEMVKTEPRRGAVEHFYKAVQRAFLTSEVTKHYPKSAQQRIFAPVLEDLGQDMTTALDSGKFDEREDYVVSRTPAVLDGRAREEAEKLGDEFIERFLLLEAESTLRRRNGEGDGEEISTTAALLVFGSLLGKNLKATRKKGRKQGQQIKPQHATKRSK
jgi:DNA-binding transcriptional ArsR family regulator